MFTNHLSRPPSKVSILVIVYNMSRQAKNTLYSLSTLYQRNILSEDYEVVVVENSSADELGESRVRKFGPNFHYFYRKETSQSPVAAINFGFQQIQGALCGLLIDGARLLSPGILQYAFAAFRINENALVSIPSYHLGPDVQQNSVMNGYNEVVEEKLLADTNWKKDGYRLFNISKVSKASARGVFSYASESNCIFLSKKAWMQIGGADERFNLAGGGLVNLALYETLVACEDLQLFVLPGEGTFHQFHGGVTTNSLKEEQVPLITKFRQQYSDLTGREYKQFQREGVLLGEIRPQALPCILQSAQSAFHKQQKKAEAAL